MLFSALPSRCIVLLEDIDTAGLRSRRSEDLGDDLAPTTDPSTTKDTNPSTAPPDRPRRGGGRGTRDGFGMPDESGEVSLSGLLNALDGVASQEGRILIMTTNAPESLDKALIRPGRVDMQVYFGHLNKLNTKRIFTRMFTPDPSPAPIPALLEGELAAHAPELEKAARGEGKGVEKEELEEMAERFAESIPEETFTPAEVQGFLLTRRKSPARALEEVAGWREEMMEAKRWGLNVIRGKGKWRRGGGGGVGGRDQDGSDVRDQDKVEHAEGRGHGRAKQENAVKDAAASDASAGGGLLNGVAKSDITKPAAASS